MTSPSTINSPEKSLELQDSVAFSTPPISEEEDDTQKLQRLIKSFALDREALILSQRESQERYERMLQENSEMNRRNALLADSHSKLQEVVILLSQQMTKQQGKDNTAARPVATQSPLRSKQNRMENLILPLFGIQKSMN